MNVGGYRPSNSWLRRQLDTSWHRWVALCFAGAAAVSVVMAAFIAPRQATLRMEYEIAQLSHSVDHLEGEQRRLLLEREALTSPALLATQLDTLGLVQVGPDQVGRLTPAGDLVLPKPTPAPARPSPARGGR
ncbi:MAG TPA: hypothetical protein PK435_01060 [Thermoanaerobaculaceae bacterium]|nr:hypothetical protein [Thermoanaerobaculaceae bacterium]